MVGQTELLLLTYIDYCICIMYSVVPIVFILFRDIHIVP